MPTVRVTIVQATYVLATFVHISDLTQNIFGHKVCWTQNIFGHKIFMNTFFRPKISCPKTFFLIRIFFRPKFFSDLKFFLKQFFFWIKFFSDPKWTLWKMIFGGRKQSFWTWGLRFYFHWSLTLETKSCLPPTPLPNGWTIFFDVTQNKI